MDEIAWIAYLRGLLDAGAGYVLFIILALWGGTASYIARMKKRGLPFSIMELIGEWSISGFSGLVTALICTNLEVPFELTAAAAGVSGHMGGRAISEMETYLLTKFKKP